MFESGVLAEVAQLQALTARVATAIGSDTPGVVADEALPHTTTNLKRLAMGGVRGHRAPEMIERACRRVVHPELPSSRQPANGDPAG
jgi:hypothetical protein